MKKLVILGLAVFFLSLAPSVLAYDDGPVAKAYDFKYAKFLNLNFGSVHNNVWTNANTGWNMNFLWWGGDETDTGDATARGTVDTSLNSSDTDALLSASGDGPVALNVVDDNDDSCHWHWPFCMGRCGSCGDDLDSDSDPVAIAKDKIKVKVINFNSGHVCNGVFTMANTGHNWNLGWGLDTDTGDAMATANVDTTLNTSDTDVTLMDCESGPIAMNVEEENGYGGCGMRYPCYKDDDNGDALAVAIDEISVKVKNKNFGYVGNMVMTAANSGDNFTMGGDSMTGDATARSSVSTAMNSSQTTVSVMESGSGPLAANVDGGSKAIAVEKDKVEVENKNMGSVHNFVMTSANTGSNETKKSSDSDTGDAIATSTVTNEVNSSDVSVTVNDISEGPTAVNSDGSDTMVSTPCDGSVSVCGNGGATAANLGEDGTAVAKDESMVEVENVNKGDVSNDVKTSANSGDNTTTGSHCGGDADTDTGDATATSTVDSTVNDSSINVVINW